MSAWKQFWNGTWQEAYVPEDETIRFLTENFSLFFRYSFILIVVILVSIIYCLCTKNGAGKEKA